MNANIDQLAGPRLKTDQPAVGALKSHKATAVDPPARRKTWFNNYDEEWAAFLADSSRRKSRPGINNADPESLPRVWNSPPY